MEFAYRNGCRDDLFPILDDHAEVRMSLGHDDRSSADASANIDQDRALRKILPGEACEGGQMS